VEYRWTPATMHAMLTEIERRIGTDMHLVTHDAFQQGRRAACAEIGEVVPRPRRRDRAGGVAGAGDTDTCRPHGAGPGPPAGTRLIASP
jgi:hypothetical protein